MSHNIIRNKEKEEHWQNPENFFFQKMQKKISKILIVSNRSLGHTNHLYTYKGHIEHIGFT